MLFGSEDSSARLTDGERELNNVPIAAQYKMSLAVLPAQTDTMYATPLLVL